MKVSSFNNTHNYADSKGMNAFIPVSELSKETRDNLKFDRKEKLGLIKETINKKDNLKVDGSKERIDKEEKKSMEIKKMFGNLEFGPVVNNYRLSHLGIALQNAAGEIVSYDKQKNEIVNVDFIDIDAKGMIYAIPCAIKDVGIGDVILHTNGHAVFVTSVDNGIHVVDVAAGEKKEILPTKSIFGFDFVTKIVTLIDFSGMNASAEQPFGNLLPLMLLGKNSDNMKEMLPMMMLMCGMNGASAFNFDMNNPLMLMALMGGSKDNDFFPMILMAGMMNQPKINTSLPNPSQNLLSSSQE